MSQPSPLRPSARTCILLAAALAATCVILVCLMRPQALLIAQVLQHQWEALHGVSDNLRGALAPDTGGKAACRSGVIRTIERTVPGARALLAHSLAWLATGHNGDAGRGDAR